MRSVPRLYNENQRISQLVVARVEADYNTSTLSPRVVEGEEKVTQCLGVKLGLLVFGGYKYGDLALQVGESQSETVKYDNESRGTRSRE
jgi:hypothetical protein